MRLIPAWFQPRENFAAMAKMGINCIVGPELTNPPVGDIVSWSGAAAAGMSVVLKNPTGTAIPGLNPLLAMFMLSVDEPNEPKGNSPPVPASALKPESDLLRKNFPNAMIWLSLGGDKLIYDGFPNATDKQALLDYAAICDVLTVDFYSANRNASRYPMTHTAKAVANLKALTGKPIYAWLECNDQQLDPPKAPDINRAPTPGEMLATANAAMAAGAAGVGWFFTCQSGAYKWPQSFLPMVDRHGASMQPQYDEVKAINAMLNPVTPAPVPAPPVLTVEQRLAKLEAWQAKIIAAGATI